MAYANDEPEAGSRHDQGLDALRKADGDAGFQIVESLASIAPQLADYLIDFSFGDIYTQTGDLSLLEREIVSIAACTALGTALPQLKVHIGGFLNVGGTPDEVIEIITHASDYAGFPAALNAMGVAKEVLDSSKN